MWVVVFLQDVGEMGYFEQLRTILPYGLAAIGLVLLLALYETWRLYSLAGRSPVAIQRASPGDTVEIEGTVRPAERGSAIPMTDDAAGESGGPTYAPTVAPVSGAAVTAVDVEVSTCGDGTEADDVDWWETYSTSEARPFLVDDGTGVALVDPENGRVTIERTEDRYLPGGYRPPDSFLDRLDGGPEEYPWDATAPQMVGLPERLEEQSGEEFDDVRIEESTLSAGDEVHVRGRAVAPRDAPVPADLAVEDGRLFGATLLVTEGDESDALAHVRKRIKYILYLIPVVVVVTLMLGAAGRGP